MIEKVRLQDSIMVKDFEAKFQHQIIKQQTHKESIFDKTNKRTQMNMYQIKYLLLH